MHLQKTRVSKTVKKEILASEHSSEQVLTVKTSSRANSILGCVTVGVTGQITVMGLANAMVPGLYKSLRNYLFVQSYDSKTMQQEERRCPGLYI